MPGIVAIIGPGNRAQHESEVKAMLDRMVHDAWDRSGSFHRDDLAVSCGWVSHEGTFSGCMPVWNESRDICLIFSGENFCDQVEVDQLRQRGHQFQTGNASYLVHAYEEYGQGFLERLNGGFAGLVLDLREKKVILFNDRYGLHRLYYHERGRVTYVATEAKSLLAVLPDLRSLDAIGLAEVVSAGCALENRTLFAGVSIIPTASSWIFAPGQSPRKNTYFRKESWEDQPILGEAEYYKRLCDTFERIVPRYRMGDQPVGMSLTGGFDGRMIMAWSRAEAGELPCYTFGGPVRDCADVRLARKVAKQCGQDHTTIPVGEEFQRQFPTLLEEAVYLSDGAMDVPGAVELYVNRIAREIAPVRLTGNYGSEILRHNVAFRPRAPHPDLLAPELTRRAGAVVETYERYAKGNPLSFIAFSQVPWHHFSRSSIERTLVTVRSPYLDNELVQLHYQAPPMGTSNDTALRLVADGNTSLAKIPTDRGLLLAASKSSKRLRHLWFDFTFKAEYAYDYGMPQGLAKIDRHLRPLHLERLFLGRHKFFHFRTWYREALAPYLREVLLDPSTLSRPYLQRKNFERMVEQHLSGRGNFTNEIHRILTLEHLQRTLIEGARLS